ncbi:NADPH-dependent FMN reductase [Natrinema halophilum]|uniref:NADPH-dependent FMN reductase n=1 Tax=Natrinema halophilum TaxID=1699371 RepID=UPI001F2AE489|nr:NAD(P)H-dependent oxidoreductase [Natrinema halophilum]UHQ96212.1 NAD(P)H-dependent oxidoreductase [Natrinema halophilum]
MIEVDTILGIAGSAISPSKTKSAVETSLNEAADVFDVETRLIHLAEYDIVTADGRTLDKYEGDTASVLEAIAESDAYIIGTPVYRAAYSGELKNIFDMIPRGKWQADIAPLENSAVGLIATGATEHHYLSIDQELRPIMAFFGAHTVGSSVYAYDNHFENTTIIDDNIESRLEALGRATVELANAVELSETLTSFGPQI